MSIKLDLEVKPSGQLDSAGIVSNVGINSSEDTGTETVCIEVGGKNSSWCDKVGSIRKILRVDSYIEAHILTDLELPQQRDVRFAVRGANEIISTCIPGFTWIRLRESITLFGGEPPVASIWVCRILKVALNYFAHIARTSVAICIRLANAAKRIHAGIHCERSTRGDSNGARYLPSAYHVIEDRVPGPELLARTEW